MLAALQPRRPADTTGQWQAKHATLVQALHRNLPSDPTGPLPLQCRESGNFLIGWIRLDNGDALRAELGLAGNTSDAGIVLATYLRWGDAACGRLRGDFAFAIHEPDSGNTLCARDPFGVRPLYWYCDAHQLVVASSAAVFPTLGLKSVVPDEQWIANFLIGFQPDARHSALGNVSRLAPGHLLVLKPDGEIAEKRFHRFEDTAPFTATATRRAVERYRAELDRAVADRCRSDFDLASENSGGLDSTSITASAAHFLGGSERNLHGFGFAIAAHERRLIEENARHCGLRYSHVHEAMAQRDERLIGLTLDALGHPSEHANAEMHDSFYRQCERLGLRTLLSGFGGDEIVTAQAFQLNRELWSNRAFVALARNLTHSRGQFLPQFRALAEWLRHGKRPAKGLAELFRWRWDRSVLADRWRHDEKLHESNASRAESDASDTVNGQILARGMRPYMQARLEGCTLIAAAYGIDYRWPLLDQELVQTYLDTPAIEKSCGLMGRWLHRRATRGLIPDSINQQRGKSMGSTPIPTAPAFASDIDGFIEALHPATFDHIDPQRLRNLHAEMGAHAGEGARRVTRFYIDTTFRIAQLSQWLSRLRIFKGA